MRKFIKKLLPLLLVVTLLLPVNSFLPTAEADATPNIPVLLYHDIKAQASSDTDTQYDTFLETIKYLDTNGYSAISADDYLNYMKNGVPSGMKPVLLTFDDGNPGVLNYALPLLKQYDMQAVLFVVPAWHGTTAGYGMSLSQLEYIHENFGDIVTFENHTYNHSQNVWNAISEADAEAELTQANAFIENITGRAPKLLAYPYGQFNANTKTAASNVGIEAGFKVGYPNGSDMFEQGRHYIQKTTTLASIAAMVGGPDPTAAVNERVAVATNPMTNTDALVWSDKTVSTDLLFAGNADGKGIKVADRAHNYQGVDIKLDSLNLTVDKSYTVTFSVYSEDSFSDASQQIQAAVMTYSDMDNKSYYSVDYSPTQAFTALNAQTGTLVSLPFTYTANTASLRIQLNPLGDGNTQLASFIVGEVVITADKAIAPPPVGGATVYHETFDSGSSIAVQSGGASLTYVNSSADGESNDKALYVSNRANNYDAADFGVGSGKMGLTEGQTYTLEAKLYVDETATVPEGSSFEVLKLKSSNPSYTPLTGSVVSIVPGKEATITLSFVYEPGDNNLRFQTNDTGKTVPFYINDVKVIAQSTAPPVYKHVLYKEPFTANYNINNTGGKNSLSGGPTLNQVEKEFVGNDDNQAIYISNRTADYFAFDVNLGDDLVPLKAGQTYTVTASVYTDADVTVPTDSQFVLVVIGENGEGGATYDWANAQNIVAGQPITLQADITAKSTDAKLRIQTNGTGATIPFYIGDIEISYESTELPPRAPSIPFETITFEDGQLGPVTPRGTATLTVVSDENHTEGGQHSLLVTARGEHWNGPAIDIAKYLDEGVTYKFSAWVKLASAPADKPSVPLKLTFAENGTYPTVQEKTVTIEDGWVLLEGTKRFDSLRHESLTLYVETPYNQTEYSVATFYIDDISIEALDLAPVEVDKTLMPLKDVYSNHFMIGNAVNQNSFAGKNLELLEHHHNLVTAENAMKPDQIQATKGTFTFEAADAIIESAQAKGMDVHGHVLVWHSQSPAWMNEDANGNSIDRDEAIANMYTHIETVMRHFGTDVISWDVVNEAMNDSVSNPSDWRNALRKSMWYESIGDDFVELAFLKAREIVDEINEDNGTDIKLFYNDYNEESPNKSLAIYYMVKELNEKYAANNNGKLLIDGIGMQAHYNINTRFSLVEAALNRFKSLGVEIGVTELDITIPGDGSTPPTEQQLKLQAYLYAQLFDLYKRNSQYISRVTLWGIHDDLSWRKEQFPLLFDSRLKAKPAYYAAVNPTKYMEENPYVQPPIKQGVAQLGTPTVDGEIDDIWRSAPALTINTFQQAHNVATGTAKVLWDEDYLYILATVNDTELDKQSVNAYEQDSIEIFVDELNEKSVGYGDDDGQYRVNFDNETSFGSPHQADGFESATTINGTIYTVEAKIPWEFLSPKHNDVIGFDIQINDARDGKRRGVAAWNDSSGQGYNDTSVFGEVTLKDPSFVPPQPPQGNTQETVSTPSTIVPDVTVQNGVGSAQVTEEQISSALTSSSNQVVTIDLTKSTATSFGLTIPASTVNTASHAYTIDVKTAFGTISIPSDALNNNANASGMLTLNLSPGNTTGLATDVIAAIGNRPTISLSFTNASGKVAYSNPNAPITISLPYIPTAEELQAPDQIVVWYIDSNGNATPIKNSRYDAATKSIVFTTTHFSMFATAYVNNTFADISAIAWAEKEISAMAARNIIKGVSDTQFNPKANITRADFVALLVRALELSVTSSHMTFNDVSTSDYFYNELAIAASLKLVNGDQAGNFNPKQSLTRQDMMVLTLRAIDIANKKLPAVTSPALDDISSVSPYAKDAVNKLLASGIIKGKNNKVAPKDSLSRAEAAVVLHRIWSLK